MTLPKEKYGIDTKWLIDNWSKWVYQDCDIEDVWIVKYGIPTL